MLVKEYWGQKQYVVGTLPLGQGWHDVALKNPKKIYRINGIDHALTASAKKERFLPFFSMLRIAHIAMGLFLTIISLGTAPLFFKTVRQMYSGRQTVKILTKPETIPTVSRLTAKSTKTYIALRDSTTRELKSIPIKEEMFVNEYSSLRDKEIELANSANESKLQQLNSNHQLNLKTIQLEMTKSIVNDPSSSETIRNEFAVKITEIEKKYEAEKDQINQLTKNKIQNAHNNYNEQTGMLKNRSQQLANKLKENIKKYDNLLDKLII